MKHLSSLFGLSLELQQFQRRNQDRLSIGDSVILSRIIHELAASSLTHTGKECPDCQALGLYVDDATVEHYHGIAGETSPISVKQEWLEKLVREWIDDEEIDDIIADDGYEITVRVFPIPCKGD